MLLVSLPKLERSGIAATYTGCTSWRTVTNPWTGQAITPGSSQRFANLNSLDLSCADLAGVDFYGAVIGGVNWSKSNLVNTNFGGTSYCGGNFSGADITGSNIKSTGSWSCANQTNVYVAPSTTSLETTTTSTLSTSTTSSSIVRTTAVPSTTSTVAQSFYCLKIGGLGTTVRWLNSSTINWVDPKNQTTPFAGVPLITLAEWLNKTNSQKLLLTGEVALRPVPTAGCSSLDEQLQSPPASTTTTTVKSPQTTVSLPPTSSSTVVTGTTAPAKPGKRESDSHSSTTTMTEVLPTGRAVTTTTEQKKCAPRKDEIYIYSFFESVNVTNHGGRFDPSLSGYKYDYERSCAVSPVTKILIETNRGTIEESKVGLDLKADTKSSNCWRVARVSEYGQSDWSNKVCYTAPIKGVVAPSPRAEVPRGATGAQCLNGYRTTLTTTRACRAHRGIDFWLFKKVKTGFVSGYKPRRSYSNFAVDTGSATGKCVGICYGVPSTVNGLPRNTYVSGYFRKDGTYVRPYTRSKP